MITTNIDTIISNMIDMFNDKNGNIPKQYKSPCKHETTFLTIAEMQQSWADFNDIHTTEPFSKSHLNHSFGLIQNSLLNLNKLHWQASVRQLY